MVNILRKEKAKRYIKELAEKVQYWLNREEYQEDYLNER